MTLGLIRWPRFKLPKLTASAFDVRTWATRVGGTRRLVYGSMALLLFAAACIGTYEALFRYYIDNEQKANRQRLESLAISLDSTLSRYEAVPKLVALDPSIRALLAAPKAATRIAAANAYLKGIQQKAQVGAAYLLDAQGNALAASNWDQPQSLIGQNYSFRPYFKDAMAGHLGRFYGVGVTASEPAYFLAMPVLDNRDMALGVVAVKVSLERIETILRNSAETLFLTDDRGISFLASSDALRYRALAPLPTEVQETLQASQQYGKDPIGMIAEQAAGGAPLQSFSLKPGEAGLHYIQGWPVGTYGWYVVQIGDALDARIAALAGSSLLGLSLALIALSILYLRHRKRNSEALYDAQADLEAKIEARTRQLSGQIEQLKQSENALRSGRDAAVNMGKLEVLGQMSAGITHELSQPLATMQNFAYNAHADISSGRQQAAAENLRGISDLIVRIGRILSQLKALARRENALQRPVELGEAINQALMTVDPLIRKLGIQLMMQPVAPNVAVLVEPGRLEQVFVNLLRNAIDAMQSCDNKTLEITHTQSTGRINLCFRDHGPGFSNEALQHLFEPFFTTKAADEALGLGLATSRSIIEGNGGSIRVANAPEGSGAVLCVNLKLA